MIYQYISIVNSSFTSNNGLIHGSYSTNLIDINWTPLSILSNEAYDVNGILSFDSDNNNNNNSNIETLIVTDLLDVSLTLISGLGSNVIREQDRFRLIATINSDENNTQMIIYLTGLR